jgi:short-subunit dehydrogenase
MSGKVIVITGASAGIGAALATKLGAVGHDVVVVARRETELRKVVKATGDRALAVVADVTRREDVTRVKTETLQAFGQFDVWVNNVGRGITRPVLQLSDDDIDQIISVNLKSAVYGMQTAVPYFQEVGKGHLINVSSFLGRVPMVPFRSIYSASKAALNVLTANLRMDLRDQYPDIHVSLVMPGIVATDFHQNAIGGTPQYRPGIPSGGSGPQTADEVASVMVELIENPKSEVYTNPASADIARRYREDTEAFERNLPRRN